MRDGQVTDPGEAAAFLTEFGPVLGQAVRGSHTDWGALLELNPGLTAGLSNTARARFIHDRTVQRLLVAQATGNYPGMHLTKVRGLYVVILRDRLMLKLKKLDLSLRSRNIRTGQTTAFNMQTSLLGEDFGVVTNATSGYVLDELGSDIVRVVVVCWDGDEKQWEVDLLEDAGEDGAVVTIPAVPPPVPSRTRVVADAPAASDESVGE